MDRKEVVQMWVNMWRKLLYLDGWTIKVKTVKKGGGKAEVKPAYLSATITISDSISDRELEGYVLHELTHILLSPIRAVIMKFAQERITPQEAELIADAEDQIVEHFINILMDITKRPRVGGPE